LKKIKQAKKEHEIENNLPDALFQMSASSYYLPPEQMLLDIIKSDYGQLSKEFEKAYTAIENGESWKNALEKLKKDTKNKHFAKAINMLTLTYETGKEAGTALRETAEEIAEEMRIQRQKNTAMTIQKITLIAAGAFIIPLILGVLISMINNFDFTGITEFGMTQMNLKTITKANQAYLIEYGLLTAGFISYQENRKEKFLKYAALIIIPSLIIFNLAKIGAISLI